MKTKAKRQKKCDKKQKKENEDKFLKIKAKRQKNYCENIFENIDAKERLKRFRKATQFGRWK